MQQTSDSDPNYHITHFTEDNGLPQNTVKNITADTEGFVWIVTETGLVRFDGRNFSLYNKSNLGIPNNRFSMLLPNISKSGGPGRIYAVAENYQLIRIEAGKAVLDSQYYFNNIQRIPFMSRATKTAMLANGSPNYLRDYIAPKNYIIPVTAGNGQFYVCGGDKIAYYANWKIRYETPVQNLRYWDCFLIGKQLYKFNADGSLDLIGRTGIVSLELTGDILKDKKYNPKKRLAEVYWNNIADQVFFYFNNNLYRIDEVSGKQLSTTLVLENFDFIKRNISSVYFDKTNKRYFFGSITNGLFVLKKKDFITLRTGGNNLDNVFYGQTAYDSGSVLTPRGYLLSKSKTGTSTINNSISLITSEKNSVDSYGILTDKKGNVWRKSLDSIYCYRLQENKTLGTWKISGEINHLYEGNDGTIWIGTRESGLFSINLSDPNPQPHFFANGVLKRITYILDQDHRTLIVGTSNGIFLVDRLSRKASLINGTAGLYVRSIYIDQSPAIKKSKNVWFSTYEDGLFLFDGIGLTHFPLDKNKYIAGAHCIFADKSNYFWITTNKGLFKVSIKDLLGYAAQAKHGKSSDIFYLRYTKENGFYTNEFNGGCQPCAIRLPNQYVSLPSLDGLVWFIPEKTSQELPSGNVLFDFYDIQGKSKTIRGDTIQLPHDPQQFKIHLAVAYFGNVSNLSIAYALSKNGLKKPDALDWIDLTGNESNISIGALGAGSYSLFVRKLNGFGTDNYSIKMITLIIPPLWYETLWFQIFCLLLTILGIYLFIKLRLRIIKNENQLLEFKIATRTSKLEHTLSALEKSEQELQRQMHIQTRLIASMSHDIKTPLKFVSKTAGRIDHMVKNHRFELVSELGKTIVFTADHMHHLLENLIGYVKTQVYGSNIHIEKTNLKEILSENLQIFNGVLSESLNTFSNDIDEHLTVNTNPQLLGIIVHNLVDNANKACRGGRIRIYTEVRDQNKHLIIVDSGPGMPEDLMQWLNNPSKMDSYEKSKTLSKSYTGLGLTIVKDISLMLQISIFVEKNNGTLIHLIFQNDQ